jgi:predicted RNA-binding Zn ribbon-like protein
MNDRDELQVGEEIEPAGRQKAPGTLALVQRFLNTRQDELGIDRLDTAVKACAWLRANGLFTARTPLDEADIARLRRLREALRAVASGNLSGDLDPAAVAALTRVARTATIRVHVGDDAATSLLPAGHGADAVVATLLVIVHEAQLTGQLSRLKACRECGYAFFDRSKNRSATWCSMSICGNRIKNRAYRRRRLRRSDVDEPGEGPRQTRPTGKGGNR